MLYMIIGIILIILSLVLLLITPIGIAGILLGVVLIIYSRKMKKKSAVSKMRTEEHKQYLKDHYITVDIAGLFYHQEEISSILDDEGSYEGPCLLIPEPDNKYDPNAIKIIINGIHAGYIPKEKNAEIKNRFDTLAESDASISLDGDISGYVTMKFR